MSVRDSGEIDLFGRADLARLLKGLRAELGRPADEPRPLIDKGVLN